MRQQTALVECGQSIDRALEQTHAFHDVVNIQVFLDLTLTLSQDFAEFCRLATHDSNDAFEDHDKAITCTPRHINTLLGHLAGFREKDAWVFVFHSTL